MVWNSETLPRSSPLLVICVSRGPKTAHSTLRYTRGTPSHPKLLCAGPTKHMHRLNSDPRSGVRPTETDPWCQKTMLQGMELNLSRAAREVYAIQVRLLPRQYGLGQARFLPGQVSSISGLNRSTRPFTSGPHVTDAMHCCVTSSRTDSCMSSSPSEVCEMSLDWVIFSPFLIRTVTGPMKGSPERHLDHARIGIREGRPARLPRL